jgi:hypothetical protein
MMEHRESHLTHRQRSNEASLAWVLVCAVGAALLAVMIATQGALAQDIQDPSNGWFQKCGPVLDNRDTTPVEGTGDYDPIVFPNNPGPVGHRHLFFGASSVSPDIKSDTLEDFPNVFRTTLLEGPPGGPPSVSTCRFKNGNDPNQFDPPSGGNRSAYWVPDLKLTNGQWAGGKQLNAYYKKGASSVDANDIVPYPDGLEMVIRDSTSPKASVKWYCSNINGEGNNGNLQARPYNCNASGTYPWVTAQITFPQCGAFDASGAKGATDSGDHISHVVYPSSGGCPMDHPIVYPRLFVTVKYATSLGKGALLSGPVDDTDPATGFHVDYFEAWQGGRLQFYIDKCIKAGINCNSIPPAT